MRSAPLYALAIVVLPAAAARAGEPVGIPVRDATRPPVAARLSCSSLVRCKGSLEKALAAIAEMGFTHVDLSCLNWAPHVDVPALTADFEKEAARVEKAFAAAGLRASNLTFDSIETLPFDEYRRRFEAVARLAARLDAPLVNLMAPSAKFDRKDAVEKLKVLRGIAASAGTALTLETHTGQLTERPADAAWLCQEVPGLGLTLDPSHYYAGPNQGAPFDQLYPLALGTGLRAGGMSWAEVQLPWGKGPIDFKEVVRKLEAAGYRGYHVAEYIEGFNAVDPLAESRAFLEWARGL